MAGPKQALKPTIKIRRADMKDMIRDELYAYQVKWSGARLIVIPLEGVKALVENIAKRATIGH